MMRSFNGTSQYLYTAGMAAGGSLAIPITMACWVIPKNTTFGRGITLSDGANANVLASALMNYPAGNTVTNQWYGNNALPVSVNSMIQNVPNHVMITINSAYHTVYVNGIKGANGATAGTAPSVDYLYIGAFNAIQYLYADICDVAIWRGYGTADMAQRLFAGSNPLDVNCHDIVDYYPLGSDGIASDRSAVRNRVLTAVGSPTWSNQSPRYKCPITMKQRKFAAGIPPVPPVLKDYPIFKSPIAKRIRTNG